MDYNEENCPFCTLRKDIKIELENEMSFAIRDIFPVSDGHMLIISKRHVSNFFELDSKEQISMLDLLNEAQEKINKELAPDGFNIGININSEAGQTVPHVHIHLIPRYEGDVKNPRGGVRNVIPDKGNY